MSPCCDLYWKPETGVGSCALEWSKMEGTLLGRGGRTGGCDFPAGGRNGSCPCPVRGTAAGGPANGHCGTTGIGLEMATPIPPSLV